MQYKDGILYFKDISNDFNKNKSSFVAVLPKGISSSDELMKSIFDRLLFPGYFGFNWNALSDCLRDLHWISEHEVILIHESIPELPDDELLLYIDILYECINDWGVGEEHKLIVFFPEEKKKLIDSLIPL